MKEPHLYNATNEYYRFKLYNKNTAMETVPKRNIDRIR